MDSFGQHLGFTVDGLPSDTFAVFRVSGREAISELFSFRVEMVSDNARLASGTVVGQSACLTLERLGESRKIHGMVERLELSGITPQGGYVYRAVLVPRLHKLAMTRQNQIHGTASAVSVREVLNDELTAGSLKGAAVAKVSGRLGLNDFEIRLTQTYPQRDYIVQYDESDFAFISRLCEHYGIFYFFVHENGRDAVVFGDSRITFPLIEGSGSIAYRPPSGLANAEEAGVFRFTGCTRMVPAEVCLRDYNYRIPNLTLEVYEAVDPDGHGVVVEYGSHFRTPEEGRALARVRAEELASRKQVFEGASDSVHLTAGAVFDLTDHFHGDFNAGYLTVWVEHEATQALPGIAEFSGAAHEMSYRNRFECQPKSVEFRPSRVTPKPKIAGLTNAVVDVSGSGQRAEIDVSGRYKVRQQFDQRGEASGQASRYMRKAEPYGGANSGMHFPLLKDTEVILACVNGDPDRPIIVGAVQNEVHPSIVNSSSNSKNRIQTTSGTLFEIDDGPGSAGGGGGSASSGATMMPQRALEGSQPLSTAAGSTIMAPNSQPAASLPAASQPVASQSLVSQRAEASILTDSGAASYAKLHVNAGSADNEAYWRIGMTAAEAADLAPVIPNVASAGVANEIPGGVGIMEYTAGSRSSLINKSSYSQVNVDRFDYTNGEHRQIADSNVAISEVKQNILSRAITLEAAKSVTKSTTGPAIAGYLNDTAGRDDIGAQAEDGELRINTESDLRLNVGGNYWNEVAGYALGVYKGISVEQIWGSTADFQMGPVIEMNLSPVLEVTAGIDIEISGGLRFDGFLGVVFEARYGPKFVWANQPETLLGPLKVESDMVSFQQALMKTNVENIWAATRQISATQESLTATMVNVHMTVASLAATL